MWFGVLGTLTVRDDCGGDVRVAGPARRQLLAALLCRQGHVVSADVLIADMWGDAPPRSAAKTLQSHIVRLRDDLGRTSGATPLVTEAGGYRLEIASSQLDSLVFEQRVRDGTAEADPVAALACLDEALALFRDEAYQEFGEAAFAVQERRRLAELRWLAHDHWTDLQLRAGQAAELVGELSRRVAQAPYRERGWEQLALALYRSGRQAESLATFREVRDLLASDLGVDPGPGLQELEHLVLNQDPGLLHRLPLPRSPVVAAVRTTCPYRGLSGYNEADGAVFVGRERVTTELAGLVAREPVVVLTGPSGSGKSSLVRAGLLPGLRAGALPGSASWRTTVCSVGRLADRALPLTDVLVVDQAEQLFTLLDADQLRLATARLQQALDEDRRLILVLRSDFFDRLPDLGRLGDRAVRSVVLIRQLRDDEVRRVVLEPAAKAGLAVEPAMLEAVLDDISGQSAALPLLSVALVRTWENREDDQLTLVGYRGGGGIAGALEAAAEESLRRLDGPARVVARRLLVRLAWREGDSWVRRPLPLTEVEDPAVVSALVDGRLLTTDDSRVELVHDALLTRWPRLRDWLEERSLAADLLAHLEATARSWDLGGRSSDELYRGPRLQAALDWSVSHPDDLGEVELAFLVAAELAATAALDEATARAAREARGRRRLRVLAISIACLLVLAVAGGGVALSERGQARTAAAAARSAALAADSRRLAALAATAPDIATSSLLAVASYRLQDSPDSRGALLTAVARNQSALWRIAEPNRLLRLDLSADGRLLYAMDNQRVVRVIDVASRTLVTSYPARAGYIDGVSTDGGLVVAGAAPGGDTVDGRVSLLDAATGATRRILTTAADNDQFEPQLSGDRTWLAMVENGPSGVDRAVAVYDLRTPSVAPRMLPFASAVTGMATGRDSLVVQSGAVVTLVQLPSLATVARVSVPRLASAAPPLLALSPDGKRLATVPAANADTPLLYDTTALDRAPLVMPRQQQSVNAMAFSPDGLSLAVATAGGAVSVDRTDGTIAGSYAGVGGSVLALTWAGSSQGATALYSAGLDSEVVSWDLGETQRLLTPVGPAVPLPDGAEQFGAVIAGTTPQQTGPGGSRSVYTIDLRTGHRQQWRFPTRKTEYVNQTVSSWDGSRVIVSVQPDGGRGRAEVWDMTTGRHLLDLALPATTSPAVSLNVAISADGRFAYAPLAADRIGVFDVTTGRYLRAFTVAFAAPDVDRVAAVPWQVDPKGRLLVIGSDTGPPFAGPPGVSSPTSAGDNDPPDQRAMLVDPVSGRTLQQALLGDIIVPTAVAWSTDGTRLAVGTQHGDLLLYDAATLRRLAVAPAAVAGFVNSVAFSPDGATLVVGGTDGTLTLWGVPALQREGVPVVDPGGGWWYAWYAPSGEVVGLRPEPDKSSARWFGFKGDPASLSAAACGLAGRQLTPDEWARYAPDQPYRSVC